MSGARFLSATDVAMQLGCSRRYIYDQLNGGALAGSFFAGRWHVTQEEVDAFVEANRRAPVEPRRGRRRPRRYL